MQIDVGFGRLKNFGKAGRRPALASLMAFSSVNFKYKMPLNEEDILTALRDVYDPEIPVNVVDLGLIYRVAVTPDPDAPGVIPKHRVEVDMSMTSPGCPAHGMIMDNVRNRLACIQEVGETQVNLVWEPTWGPERISEAARKQLGIA